MVVAVVVSVVGSVVEIGWCISDDVVIVAVVVVQVKNHIVIAVV